ncbi:MAG: helix-turn-helix domain-containing protein [Bacteroidota bacterium]
MENDFLNRITEIIEENISDETFGVSELARAIGMSRSNLLRKVKNLTKLSVSQFIRQVRLKTAMEILKQGSLNVSEVSFRVGFSSTSYFIRCFREHYGYPPGEVGKGVREDRGEDPSHPPKTRRIRIVLVSFGFLAALFTFLFIFNRSDSFRQMDLEKSIAVLPFKNESSDSGNIYLINGLMESILDNLQKIEDLRVISRTSVEKYRNNPKTVPEIARELNANYLVEGSGQKIGDQILLNVQLIEAPNDKHLWSARYKREAGDIFELQLEVAKSIAEEIEALITPEERELIEKLPTENLKAYDSFLHGLDFFYQGTRMGLEKAISMFEMAIEQDPEFARAYANTAISYAILDMYRLEKEHSDQINLFAEKALLLDPMLPQSLIAKAMYYITIEDYEQALPYLEKALEYHPSSSLVINILSDFYTRHMPDTEKYLEYALMGIGLDIASHDSLDASFIYLHLSNAFMQSGFVKEAQQYIDISLEFDPGNSYAELLRAYILLAGDGSLEQTKELLIDIFQKDTSRHDVMKELGVIYYFLRDYENAHTYYSRMFELAETQGLDLYHGEKAKFGLVLSKLGMEEESEQYMQDYLDWAEKDQSKYKHLSLAAYYSFRGDSSMAIENMELFAEQEHYPYWYILFLKMDDPLLQNVKDHPEFQRLIKEIDLKFWSYNKQINDALKKKGLLP